MYILRIRLSDLGVVAEEQTRLKDHDPTTPSGTGLFLQRLPRPLPIFYRSFTV